MQRDDDAKETSLDDDDGSFRTTSSEVIHDDGHLAADDDDRVADDTHSLMRAIAAIGVSPRSNVLMYRFGTSKGYGTVVEGGGAGQV